MTEREKGKCEECKRPKSSLIEKDPLFTCDGNCRPDAAKGEGRYELGGAAFFNPAKPEPPKCDWCDEEHHEATKTEHTCKCPSYHPPVGGEWEIDKAIFRIEDWLGGNYDRDSHDAMALTRLLRSELSRSRQEGYDEGKQAYFDEDRPIATRAGYERGVRDALAAAGNACEKHEVSQRDEITNHISALLEGKK